MAIQYTEALDRTFHALGDASRRRMLATLRERGDCTAGELGILFDSAQPTISRHLQVLERAELVRRRVDGRRHVFSVAPARLEQAQDWLARHTAFWQGSLDQLGDVVEALRRDADEAGS